MVLIRVVPHHGLFNVHEGTPHCTQTLLNATLSNKLSTAYKCHTVIKHCLHDAQWLDSTYLELGISQLQLLMRCGCDSLQRMKDVSEVKYVHGAPLLGPKPKGYFLMLHVPNPPIKNGFLMLHACVADMYWGPIGRCLLGFPQLLGVFKMNGDDISI